MQGLIVNVSMADVAAIIRSTGDSSLPAAPPEQPPRNLVQTPSEKPAPPVRPEKSATQDKTARKTEIRGIGLDGLAWQMKPSEIPGIEKLNTGIFWMRSKNLDQQIKRLYTE